MLARCLERLRDKHAAITHYKLLCDNGKEIIMSAEDLKVKIRNCDIVVPDLILTSNDRLIRTESIGDISYQSLGTYISTRRANGKYQLQKTACGHYVEVYLVSSRKIIINIPDDVTDICDIKLQPNYPSSFTGTLLVTGGKGLRQIDYLFKGCNAGLIDLRQLKADNITSMVETFANCGAYNKCSINIKHLNTLKVENMAGLFRDSTISYANIEWLRPRAVKNTERMFFRSTWENPIILTKFDTSNVENMNEMFMLCNAPLLDISNFNTSSVKTSTNFLSKVGISEIIGISK